ncbi:hypothetical protein [Ruminococcus albus]|uniref:Uncharacterized protein n=1 Tax=Ruminococcus albus TaxID=1264 RepID=A0A1I1RKL9_RUMAL|nr:hypothetical protein [Ruminococcus albus]SFD34859.1 hypothetical protein SAMN02910406_03722 [Ruminococcus albus]
MDSRPKDISPEVREHLKYLKARPGMYIGSVSLTKLWHFIDGMTFYSHVFDKESGRVIIPEGFNEFVEKQYNDHRTFNSFHFVSYFEGDDIGAVDKWFSLLDEYLVSLGYEPLGEREEILEELRNRHREDDVP